MKIFLSSREPYTVKERPSRNDWIVVDRDGRVVFFGERKDCEAEALALESLAKRSESRKSNRERVSSAPYHWFRLNQDRSYIIFRELSYGHVMT